MGIQGPKLVADRESSMQENRYATQKQAKFHVLYYLLDILRFGKDEMVSPTADLISLDLDRARFDWLSSPVDEKITFTWCFACFMDRFAYEALGSVSLFGALKRPKSQQLLLGKLLHISLQETEDYPIATMSNLVAKIIDARVTMLLSCLGRCIESYGPGEVLLWEKKPEMPHDLIKYYVLHSEYSNRAGRRPPENWLEFLFEK